MILLHGAGVIQVAPIIVSAPGYIAVGTFGGEIDGTLGGVFCQSQTLVAAIDVPPEQQGMGAR